MTVFSLGLDFLGPYRQSTRMAEFRKLDVLKASFSKNLLQIITK